MIIRTKTKIFLAGLAQRVVMGSRRLIGKGPMVNCRRGGINWRLNLGEGIDFSIFLLGAFERSTAAAYRRLVSEGSVVIDIGGNIGAHTLPLAMAVGRSGLVVVVEPTRYAFDKMQEQIALNEELKPRIHAHQVMLMGRRDAALVDALPSSWPLSDTEGGHEQHLGVFKDTKGTIVTTLDALVEQEGLKKVDFIKLDVDGYEVEVLRGATNVLRKYGPSIIFEHCPYILEEIGYNPNEVLDILRNAGYRFCDLKGRPFGDDGANVPNIPMGAGINVLARRLDH